MTTPAEIREAVAAACRGIDPRLSVYTGVVPDAVPVDTVGRVRPYLGLWVTNPTGRWDMGTLDGTHDVDSHTVRIHTQCVAADEANVYWLADHVRAALTNLPVGGHRVAPDWDQQASAFILTDTGVTPPRPYLPLFWGLTTQ